MQVRVATVVKVGASLSVLAGLVAIIATAVRGWEVKAIATSPPTANKWTTGSSNYASYEVELDNGRWVPKSGYTPSVGRFTWSIVPAGKIKDGWLLNGMYYYNSEEIRARPIRLRNWVFRGGMWMIIRTQSSGP